MADLTQNEEKDRVDQLRKYIDQNVGLRDEWKENARTYLLASALLVVAADASREGQDACEHG